MTKKEILIILAVVLFAGSGLYAVPVDKIFTSDGVIIEGDKYARVSIYDTPPHRTTVGMFGGSAYTIFAYDSSILNKTGGTTEVYSYNKSTINVGGGTIYTLNSYDSSNINIFGGLTYHVSAYDTTTVNVLDNANLFTLFALDSGVINMSGGRTSSIGAAESSTVNLYGGLVTDDLSAGDSGIINVYGYNLAKFPTGGKLGDGFVLGEWENGVTFNFYFYGSNTYSHIILHEIPEPATILLIVIGSIVLRRRRTF